MFRPPSLLFIFLLVVLGSSLKAQLIKWENNYGGSNHDQVSDMLATKDSGYVLVGTTNSKDHDLNGYCSSRDGWMIKIDKTGTLEWNKLLCGDSWETAKAIQKRNGGNFLIAAHSNSDNGTFPSNYGEEDIWAIETDQWGNILWKTRLGTDSTDKARDILPTSDGGCLLAGFTSTTGNDVTGNYGKNDAWVAKLDGNGNLQWEQNYGGTSYDTPTEMVAAQDGGTVVCGYSSSSDHDLSGNNGNNDVWVFKIDSVGTMEWSSHYGGSERDLAYDIQRTPQGGYMVVGGTESNDMDVGTNKGGVDLWVLRLNNNGGLQWEKSYGGSSSDIGRSIRSKPDSGYVVGGLTGSDDGDVSDQYGNDDYWILDLSSNGSLNWENNYGGSYYEGFVSSTEVRLTPSKANYVLGGSSGSEDHDVSMNYGSDPKQDFWALMIDTMPANTPSIAGRRKKQGHLEVHSNPFQNKLRLLLPRRYRMIRTQIRDLKGRIVHRTSASYSSRLSLKPDLPAGVYLLDVRADGDRFSKKVIREP